MQSIKTALCSFGMSGSVFHAPFLHLHPGFEMYAVFERSKNTAVAKYPGITTYRSLDSMLQDEAIELLVVNTPNYTHYEYAKAGLEAGKHIIVEKPFTLDVREAQELIMLAQKQQRKLSVYQNRRWDSDFKTVQSVVAKKLLGNIAEAEIHFDRYKEDISPKVHKETPGPGTGLLYDLGSHLIDQAIQLFGMPQKVFADVGIIRAVSKVPDYMELLLFCGNVRVRLKASYMVREAVPAYILHGSAGSFLKSRADVQEEELKAGKSPIDVDWGKEPESERGLLHASVNGKVVREHVPTHKGNYMEYYDGIYKAIRENAPLPVTAEDGMLVIAVIEAAHKSVAEKRIVEVLRSNKL